MSNYRRRLILANQSEENLYLYGNSVQEGTPTPDAPMDVMSIENPTIKIMSNNMFNCDKSLMKTISFISETNGTLAERVGFELNLKPGNYTIKAVVSPNSTSSTAYIYGCVVGSDNVRKKTINCVQASYLPPYLNFNIEEGDKFKIYDGIKDTNVSASYSEFQKFNIMINKGTTALPYEPYYEENITIDEDIPFGKNLYDKDNVEIFKGYMTETGFWKVDSGSTSFRIPCLPNKTYVISANNPNCKIFRAGYSPKEEYPEEGKTIKLYNWIRNSSTENPLYVNTGSDAKYLMVQVSSTDYQTTLDTLQIELDKHTSYESYKPTITTFRGIGDYRDRIYTKDGKVLFEQRSALYEISPDAPFTKNRDIENLGLQCYAGGVISDNKYFGVPTTAPMAARESGLSTHFMYSERAYGGWGFTDCVFMRVNKLWLLSDNFTTDEEVRQWIADNKVNIIYPLATPIVTEITGFLAEKILAIDTTKNIYFISENGVYGETEVIEE